MKKLLLILFCISPLMVLGQTPGNPSQVNNTNYYSFQNYAGAVKGFMLPQRDTNWTPSAPALVYRPADSSLYYWKWTRWQKVGGISSSNDTSFSLYLLKTDFIDSLNNNRQTITRRNDSLFLTFGGSLSMVPDSTVFPTWYAINDSGYIKKETDPVFTSSPAYTITTLNINNWQTAYNSASTNGDTLILTSITGGVNKIPLLVSQDTTKFRGTGQGYGTIKTGNAKVYGDTLAYSVDTMAISYPTSVHDSVMSFGNSHNVTLNGSSTISVTGASQPLSSNPSFSLSANNTQPLWNAVQLQGLPIINTAPSAGQVLFFNGTSWAPYSLNPGSGTVTSVGMTAGYGETVSSNTTNPITSTGVFTPGVDTTKIPNLRYTDSALATKLTSVDTTGNWAPRGSYVHPADTVGRWSPVGNYKMNYDSTASTGYMTHYAHDDSLSKNALSPLAPIYVDSVGKTLYIDTSSSISVTTKDFVKNYYSGTGAVSVNNSTGVISVPSGSVSNTMLTNSTISGVTLGGTLSSLTPEYGLTGSAYNGSAAETFGVDSSKYSTLNFVKNYYSGGSGITLNNSTGVITSTEPIWTAAKSAATDIQGQWEFDNGIRIYGYLAWNPITMYPVSAPSGSGVEDANNPFGQGGYVASGSNPSWLKDSAMFGYGGLLTFGRINTDPILQLQYVNPYKNDSLADLAFRTSIAGDSPLVWSMWNIIASQEWTNSAISLSQINNALSVLSPLILDTTNKTVSLDTAREGNAISTVYHADSLFDNVSAYMPVILVTANDTLNSSNRVVLVDATSSALTITVPNTFTSGKAFTIKNISTSGTNAVTISLTSQDFDSGGTTYSLSVGKEITFIYYSGRVVWYLINNN